MNSNYLNKKPRKKGSGGRRTGSGRKKLGNRVFSFKHSGSVIDAANKLHTRAGVTRALKNKLDELSRQPEQDQD